MTERDEDSTPSLTRDTRLKVSPDVVSADVDGELVLMDSKSGVYFSLNAVGARLWVLAGGGSPLGAIADSLLTEYEVEPTVLWRDLAKVIEDLRQNSLIEVLPGH